MSSLQLPKHGAPSQAGITLAEALVTLAIIAILLALALPSMRAFVIQNRLAAETRLFIAALTLARVEAIKRGSRVQICRSNNADATDGHCSAAASGDRGGSDWAAGWLVVTADKRQILLRQGALDANTQALAGRTTIAYHAGGNASASFTNVVFSHKGEFSRTVCIASSGRIGLQSVSSLC